MQPLLQRVQLLKSELEQAMEQLHVDTKQLELDAIDAQLAEGNVWTNVERAQSLSKQAASLRAQIEPWQTLQAQVGDMAELMTIGDETMLREFDEQVAALETEYARLKKDLLFRGEFDDHDALVKLSAGAGGTDAQDWCEMLERMYLRWAEKSGMKTELLRLKTKNRRHRRNCSYLFTRC